MKAAVASGRLEGAGESLGSIPLAKNGWTSCGVHNSRPQRWCSLSELIHRPYADMSRLELDGRSSNLGNGHGFRFIKSPC
jgi:hypothetical protein